MKNLLYQSAFNVVKVYDAGWRDNLINTISQIDGFLCNFQIPIMYDLAGKISGKIVEVGVWKGRTTITLGLGSSLTDLKIDCIDTFLGSEEHKDTLNGKSTYDEFVENIEKFKLSDKINIVRKSSVEAALDYKANSIDAVFIDAAHDYINVKNDISAWFQCLKHGGIMMGHDYPDPQDKNGGFEDLARAVNENVRDNDKYFYNFGYVAGLWFAQKI